MLEHDFSKLVLNRDRRVDELIKDDEFIHFSKWLSQAFKWELADDFFVSIFNSFKLKNFTIVQFKAMQRQDIQITSQDKAYYTPSQLKYVVMAKKYLSVSSKDKV